MDNLLDNASDKAQLQVGVCDKDLVLQFRQQTGLRKFKKIDVLRVMLNWWIAMEHEEQKALYYISNEELADCFSSDQAKQTPTQADFDRLENILAIFEKYKKEGRLVSKANPKTSVAEVDAAVKQELKRVGKQRRGVRESRVK